MHSSTSIHGGSFLNLGVRSPPSDRDLVSRREGAPVAASQGGTWPKETLD